jgi:hypothetical protein
MVHRGVSVDADLEVLGPVAACREVRGEGWVVTFHGSDAGFVLGAVGAVEAVEFGDCDGDDDGLELRPCGGEEGGVGCEGVEGVEGVEGGVAWEEEEV